MGDVANVRVGLDGLAAVAPVGTTLPTTTAATLDPAFKDLGLVSEDGLEEAFSLDSNPIRAWDGSTVRKVSATFDATFKLTFLERNRETIRLYYGGAEIAAAGTGSVVKVKPFTSDLRSMVLDVLDGDAVTRYVLPKCEVTDRGARQHRNNAASGYEVTVTAYPDGTGVSAYIYSDEDFSAS